ncbi:D-alanyl-D-alanine carboxypeptidase/D-alanyl-D-alanine endopeptidase [Sphingosinicella rhizophila]|uniref:D-alanyl-D-alanine carboxypeptidase/D-alanyl-D-alanine-endopeptidase n=1 Tax=Sphingosinicella rhizophila TaxID=3050082 RepID=A0ABU3Q9F5_9SPHN|nr:D-alanyl-D-alanine carboxypeptidase/D-alanyl-D-alanine-endopeptidase [Sphingosinicella sp. GR2756]MDT9600024.1 D-alanyl-D-alanine carboxypeptidase/D-alanyl-D-alanine-endopeptidase [Sphingosinicella sp. GR2756]
MKVMRSGGDRHKGWLRWGAGLCLAVAIPAPGVAGGSGITDRGAEAADPARAPLAARIEAIMKRPEYRHARFGMKFVSLKDGRTLYEHDADQLFVTGSTGKLFPAGAALATLGPDFRFRTKVYRTGPIVDGVLKGDLVLVASGDPNLSGRIGPDGSLAFVETDHSYDMLPGAAVAGGDPLQVIRRIAEQVAAKGIKRIDGAVRVDTSLFPEAPWVDPRAIISPISVNDNIVDVTVSPGANPGGPAILRISPETSYVRIVNRTNMVADGPATVGFVEDVRNPDGTHVVTLAGNMPTGQGEVLRAYRAPEPQRFAETLLAEALREKGVAARTDHSGKADFGALAAAYTPANQVAEHISPPLTEAVKVVLKVSHNPHAAMFPKLLGAYVAKDNANALAAGFGVQRSVFEKAGMELDAAMQVDGSGAGSRYSPDATVRFLQYMAKQPYFRAWLTAQPIMGKDGTLAKIQKDSVAAGHVYAKTGTEISPNLVNGRLMLMGKGLGGYVEGPTGEVVAFGLYANNVPIDGMEGASKVGEALGEIATAVYESMAAKP